MIDFIIQFIIFSFLIIIIKKTSSIKTYYGLVFFYLLILYDNTIITGTIFNNNPIFIIQSLILIYFIIYLSKYPMLFSKNLFKINFVSTFIIITYFSIFFIEIIRLIFITNDQAGLVVVFNDLTTKIIFLLLFIFLLNKNEINNVYKLFDKIIKPYVYISLFIVISSVIVMFCAALNFVDLDHWTTMPSWLDEQIHHRKERFTLMLGQSYQGPFSFPYFFTLVWTYDMLEIFTFQGFLNIGGRMIGLSKEPHIACFFLTPSLFLIKHFISIKRTKIVYLCYMLFFASVLSLSNIISLLLIFILYQLRSIITLQVMRVRYIILSIFSLFILFLAIYLNYEVVEQIFKRFNEIGIAGSSGEIVILRFKQLFIPESFWGEGFLVTSKKQFYELRDYGFLPLIIFLSHYILVFAVSIKLYFSRNIFYAYGLSVIYVLIHGIKIYADLPINYFYLLLVLSLIFLLNQDKNKITYSLL